LCWWGGDIPTVGRLEHVPHLILGRRDVGVGVGGAHPPQASHCVRGWGSEMPGGFAICPPRPTKRPPASRAPPARPCPSFHRRAAPPEAARAGILQHKGERGSFPHRRRQPGSEQLPIGWSHRSAWLSRESRRGTFHSPRPRKRRNQDCQLFVSMPLPDR
jgi:hypothetical protein